MERLLRLIAGISGIILTCILVATISKNQIDKYETSIEADYDHPTVGEIEEELNCMALNVYREAAGEPFEGKVAVAQVTLNRVAHEDFPDTVCEVVHEKNIFMKKVVCQFSWYCSNRNKTHPTNSLAYQESYEVAKKVMLEDFRLESVENAIYFHSDNISPNWNYKQVAKIGNHIFYTDNT